MLNMLPKHAKRKFPDFPMGVVRSDHAAEMAPRYRWTAATGW